jgi:hypothetical protein
LLEPVNVLFGVLLQVFFGERKSVSGRHQREYLLDALLLPVSVYVHVHALGRHVVAVITRRVMIEADDGMPFIVEFVFELGNEPRDRLLISAIPSPTPNPMIDHVLVGAVILPRPVFTHRGRHPFDLSPD